MKNAFMEAVYGTLLGVLEDEACISDVQCLFEEGMPCHTLYSNMLAAYDRVRQRLGMENEDPDIEEIINSLLKISQITGYEMFCCGTRYASYFTETQNAPD